MKTLKNLALSGALLLSAMLFSTNANAQDKKAPQLTDPEIASVAVTANQIDVDYANIALKKSKSKAIKAFATTMKNDHTNVINMAVALAKKLNVTPQTNDVTKSLLEGQKKIEKEFAAKKGKAFDKAYIDNEVAYHKFAINAVETLLIPESKNAELKALLEKALPLFKEHLAHAEMVQKNFK